MTPDKGQQELITITNNFKALQQELGVYKAKAREFEDKANSCEIENKKLKANADQTLKMAADMAEQHEQSQTKCDGEKLDLNKKIETLETRLEELIKQSLDYHLRNESKNCQLQYRSEDKTFGKVCYGEGMGDGLWFTASEDTAAGKILKAQFDSAETKIVDGALQKKS